MSGQLYIDADKIADTRDYLRNGGDEEQAAAYLQCTVEELPQLLGEPAWKREPVTTQDDATFDLFRVDELENKL